MSTLHKASAVLVIFSLIMQPAWARPPLFQRWRGPQTPQPTKTVQQSQSAPRKVASATPPAPATAPALEASEQVKAGDIAPPKFPPEPVVTPPPAISLNKQPTEEPTPPAPAEAFTNRTATSIPDWWTTTFHRSSELPKLFVKPDSVVSQPQPFSLVPVTPEVKSDTGSTQEAIPPLAPEAATADPYAAPPIELLGVDKPLPLGELVQVAIKPITNKPERLRDMTYTWTVLPPRNVVVWPDASKIIFGAGTRPQTYTIIVTGSYAFAPDKSLDPKAEVVQRLVTKVQNVQVGDGTVAPPVGPNVPPAPDLTPVARKIFEFTQLVVTDGTYSMANFKTDAALLARNFAAVVAAIEDPDPANRAKLATISDIMKATKNQNDSNKVSNHTAWQAWFDQTTELIRQAYSSNTIKSPQDAAAWWRDIAAGLEAAAR